MSKLEIKQLPPTPLAEWNVAIYDGDTVLFSLGFNRLSLLSDIVYITMVPTEALHSAGLGKFRELSTMFSGISGWRLVCQIDKNDPAAARWARFFGFKFKEFIGTRLHFEKDTR